MRVAWSKLRGVKGKRGRSLALLLPLSIAVFLAGAPAWPITAEEVLQRVEGRYGTLRDLTADFTWSVRADSGSGEQEITGHLYLKRPHLLRLELDDGHLLVSDGRQVWRYSPTETRVVVDSLDRPLWWEELFSHPLRSFQPQLVGEEKVKGKRCYLVDLTRREEGPWVGRLRIWVDRKQWLIRRMEALGWGGEVANYRFTRIRLNRGLADSLFTCKPLGR